MADFVPTPQASTPTAAELVRIEAAGLEKLATRLEGPMRDTFARAVERIVEAVRTRRRTIVTGVGKSGLIARKIAATLVSTGTPAQFLHPSDALHGDLGVVTAGDVVLALSYSGETEELLRLIPVLPRLGATLISITGCTTSTLASASAHVLDVAIDREACSHQLAPTASTTAMLALGDALAMEVSARLDFKPRDFADLHPGGQLGKRLVTVRKLMHTGAEMPSVPPTATMPQIIHEMSAKRLGVTLVHTHDRLLGILSDGDLRRLLERNGPHAFHKTAGEIVNHNPRTIPPETLAIDALILMEQRKITSLVVTEEGPHGPTAVGVVHLHDLWEVAPEAPASESTEITEFAEVQEGGDPSTTSDDGEQEPEFPGIPDDEPGHEDEPGDDGRL
ncbi:arabinose-5-phosphate isomerase [Bryocella elongata]|uniref:Arabinose-5-phosphate isomerase n=1 Tax=Bryocella elongata TaxID=863522 RepID=A0A1H6B3Y4_9BACT|nr:KpsF/GutQ family sugar-phosphate isomerase [Bryocella elongata]SEG54937.1 arabinose-5-phosphate isomerase [Bryocella elongata]